MPANPCRLQFHLLTAIALMFAAGALIKLNLGRLKPVPGLDYRALYRLAVAEEPLPAYRALGWPYQANPKAALSPTLKLHTRDEANFSITIAGDRSNQAPQPPFSPSASFKYQDFIRTSSGLRHSPIVSLIFIGAQLQPTSLSPSPSSPPWPPDASFFCGVTMEMRRVPHRSQDLICFLSIQLHTRPIFHNYGSP